MEPVEELFDLKNDPLELKSLAVVPEAEATLDSMRKRYDVELQKWKDHAVDYNNYTRYGTLFDRNVPVNEKTALLRRKPKPSAPPKKQESKAKVGS